VTDPARAIAAALERYERWLADPESAAWHALKRLCVSGLMLHPLDATTAEADLASAQWLRDYAQAALARDPAEVASRLLADLGRTGAIELRSGRLGAAVAHVAPDGPVPASAIPQHGHRAGAPSRRACRCASSSFPRTGRRKEHAGPCPESRVRPGAIAFRRASTSRSAPPWRAGGLTIPALSPPVARRPLELGLGPRRWSCRRSRSVSVRSSSRWGLSSPLRIGGNALD